MIFDIEKKIIEEFQKLMKQRIESGRKKYGLDYLHKDLNKDMKEELLDLANYALLLYMRIRLKERLKDFQKD